MSLRFSPLELGVIESVDAEVIRGRVTKLSQFRTLIEKKTSWTIFSQHSAYSPSAQILLGEYMGNYAIHLQAGNKLAEYTIILAE